MLYTYKSQGTCSSTIDIDVDESGVVRDICFHGGCDGNAKGLRAMVIGANAKDVIHRLSGIQCASKPTSCPDQLARALKQMLEG